VANADWQQRGLKAGEVQETGNYAPPNRYILYFIFFGECSQKFIPAARGGYALMAKVSRKQNISCFIARHYRPAAKYPEIRSMRKLRNELYSVSETEWHNKTRKSI